MMKLMNAFLFLLFLSLLSCTGNQNSGNTDSSPDDTPNAKETSAYRLIPFDKSEGFPDASIESMNYADGTFNFEIGGESYKLGVQTTDAPKKSCANSAKGQHIHLIVNNLPYAAKYTGEFDYQIPDGEHYILSFLSRSYHESIKTQAAHRAIKAQVNDQSFASIEPIREPMLFYSRPKGVYTGEDTKKVMLDFYLVNATMKNYTVRADINGDVHNLDTWQPYYIEGLPNGDNTITLTLLDKEGKVVKTPHNPVTRKFKIEGEPQIN